MNPLDRTPLERARHHVIEVEDQVAKQIAWIAELKRRHEDTAEADTVLADLEDQLRFLYEALGRELERAEASRRHW